MKIETKVGIFVVLGLISLFVLSTSIQSVANFGKDGYVVNLPLADASGIEVNAKVKANGVSIGYVQAILLDKNMARLKLFIFKDYSFPDDSIALVTQESLLGSKHVNILQGQSSVMIVHGGTIGEYKKFSSVEESSQKIYEAAEEFRVLLHKINSILDDNATADLASSMSSLSEGIKTIASAAKEFNNMGVTINEKLPYIIGNLDKMAKNFSEIGENANKELPALFSKVESIANKLGGFIDYTRGDLNSTLVSVKKFFDSGKNTVETIDDMLSAVNKAELSVGVRGENLFNDNYPKSYFSASYRPNPSNYYLLDLVSSYKLDEVDAVTNKVIMPSKHKSQDTFISAQLGKRYDDLLLRVGLIESTGGVGADYFANADRLKASVDLFDFSSVNDIRGSNPHAKLSFRYSPFKFINVFAGLDNFLNKDALNVFLGAGIEFVDDDIKKLVISSGAIGAMK